MRPRSLVLEDGRTFRGEAYGAEGETFGEAVFATGMTGYQETLTDPSYHRQVVVMTAPHIGNTGMNDEDPESARIWVAGYVVRDPARVPSSWRSPPLASTTTLRDAGRGRHLRHRHPRPDPAPARARRDAGRHLHAPRPTREALLGAGARAGRDGRREPGRRGLHRRAVRRPGASARSGFTRRRARPRHQGEHPADDGRARHRDPRAAGHRHPRRRAGRRRPTGCSSPTAPATRRPRRAGRAAARGARAAASRTSASASATSSSAGRWASAPTS